MTDDDKALDKIIRASMPLDFDRKETLSDDKSLVERLRWSDGWFFENPWDHVVYASDDPLEAADRIEALTAENERLEKEVAQAWCDDAMPCRQLLDAKQDNERLNHANQELQSENARMREAGTKLNDYACHDDDCQIVTHGVWSDPIPCTCGYEDAWKAWAALGEAE